jgi:hypothetical protein
MVFELGILGLVMILENGYIFLLAASRDRGAFLKQVQQPHHPFGLVSLFTSSWGSEPGWVEFLAPTFLSLGLRSSSKRFC